MVRFRLVFALLAVLQLGAAAARTWRVTPDGGGDAPTIQAAIDSASAGDVVLLAAGTYAWASQDTTGGWMVRLKPDLTLRSESGAAATILDGQHRGRAVRCLVAGNTISIEGLTIANCLAGILSDHLSTPTLSRCVVRNTGMGIDCSDIIVRECEILNNGGWPEQYGVGIRATGRLEMSNSRVTGNRTTGTRDLFGGGIWASEAHLSDCWIEDNRVEGIVSAGGGGASVDRGTITRCVFVGNRASAIGFSGGYCLGGGLEAGEVLVTDCVFIDNAANGGGVSGWGGAIGSRRVIAPLNVTRCTLVGNAAMGLGSQLDQVAGVAAPLAEVTECIFAWNEGIAVSSAVRTNCTNFFGNGLGDMFRGVDMGGNLSADPQFCAVDPRTTRFVGLQSDSPCAPGQHPDAAPCARIGAADVQCASVLVQRRTWSDIKRLFGNVR